MEGRADQNVGRVVYGLEFGQGEVHRVIVLEDHGVQRPALSRRLGRVDLGDFASEPRSRVREVSRGPAADERLGIAFATAADGAADWDKGISVGSRGVFLFRAWVYLLRAFLVVVQVCVHQIALKHCLLAVKLRIAVASVRVRHEGRWAWGPPAPPALRRAPARVPR